MSLQLAPAVRQQGLNNMHEIKHGIRIDYYLELFFEDGSVRSINLAPHLGVDPIAALNGEPIVAKVLVHQDKHAIIWDNSTEISSDFLYDHSLLIGWAENPHAWRPIKFNKAEIRIEGSSDEVLSYLLLDGKRYPALSIASASFGIHENTAWYQVPFPGDDGVYEPELEYPQVVSDTLKQLVVMVSNALEVKKDVTINITEQLQRAGHELFVESISPRNVAIIANRFKKNAA